MFKSSAFILSFLFLVATVSFSAPGDVDPTFGQNGAVIYHGLLNEHDSSKGVAIQPDGKIVVVGYTFNGETFDVLLLRCNNNGTLDNTFGTGGVVQYDYANQGDFGYAVAIQPDGKIVVVGSTYDISFFDQNVLVLRFNSNGTIDNTFGTNGVATYNGDNFEDTAYAVAIQQDGKIVIVGSTISISGGHDDEVLVLRYNTDGTLDNTFGTGGVVKYDYANDADYGYGVAIQQDGKIVITGSSYHPTYNDGLIVLRYNVNGTLDNTFGTGGIVRYDYQYADDRGYGVTIQSDGKVIVAGCTFNGQNFDVLVLRYNSNGTLDSTFGGNGIVIHNGTANGDDYGRAVSIQADGRIVVVGESYNGTDFDVLVLRYNSNGTLDSTFGENGIVSYNGTANDNDYGLAVAIQTDGKIVITGSTYLYWPSNDDVLIVRLIGRNKVYCDFDGDGKTDIAVYRANTGAWYVYPSKFGVAPYGFGWGGDLSDKPVPGDYDGDGKTDLAVYRASTGAWYVYPSGGGSPYGFGWGGDPSDKPVPGDYDGDGKTDIAVYRTATGAWYVYPSGGGTPSGFGWGGDPSDKPVPGNYDGDGKTDIAVYRTGTGAWYVYPSGGASPYGFGWGGDPSDKPTPGDYDGDGKTDYAVYRSSTGAWYIKPTSGASPYGIGWGGDGTDIPVIR